MYYSKVIIDIGEEVGGYTQVGIVSKASIAPQTKYPNYTEWVKRLYFCEYKRTYFISSFKTNTDQNLLLFEITNSLATNNLCNSTIGIQF